MPAKVDWKTSCSSLENELNSININDDEALEEISKITNMVIENGQNMTIRLHDHLKIEDDKNEQKAKILDAFIRQHGYAMSYYGTATIGVYKLSEVKNNLVPLEYYWHISKREIILFVNILKKAQEVSVSLVEKEKEFTASELLLVLEPIMQKLNGTYSTWIDTKSRTVNKFYSLPYATSKIEEFISLLKKSLLK